jgi:hypothetical protein
MSLPLCFVLMPFGQKPDAGGARNAVRLQLIVQSINSSNGCVDRTSTTRKPTYSTRLELAVLANDEKQAQAALANALASEDEWQSPGSL